MKEVSSTVQGKRRTLIFSISLFFEHHKWIFSTMHKKLCKLTWRMRRLVLRGVGVMVKRSKQNILREVEVV